MRRLSVIISLALLLSASVSGCRTVKSVESVKTEHAAVYKTDSVWINTTDTLRVFVMGDTVRIFEKQTLTERYYTFYRDTLRTSDTLRVEKVVQVPQIRESKPVKWWRWFFAGFCVGIIVIFAVRIIMKIYLKI